MGFVYSDYVGFFNSRMSTTCYVFTLFGGVLSWKSCLQRVVAFSTTEAEYITATEAMKGGLWLKRFCR